jgi:hypothetical protein
VLAVSGDVPTSSDEEVGRTPLFTFGRVSQVPHQAAANSSDDAEYYSTSSTSSSGSSNRDLEAKAALWCEYLRHPADVVSRFAPIAPVSRAGGSASNLEASAHDPVCSSLGDRMKHCDCHLKQQRRARHKARQQERLSRWFAAKRAEEAGAEADDEDEVEIN